jgi:hypothetical protein
MQSLSAPPGFIRAASLAPGLAALWMAACAASLPSPQLPAAGSPIKQAEAGPAVAKAPAVASTAAKRFMLLPSTSKISASLPPISQLTTSNESRQLLRLS